MATTLRKDVERLEKEVANLKSQLVEAEQLLRQNEDALLRSEKTDAQALNQARAEAAKSKRQIEALHAELSEKTATIDNLEEKLAAAEKVDGEWQTKVDALQSQLEEQVQANRGLERKLASQDNAKKSLVTCAILSLFVVACIAVSLLTILYIIGRL